MMVVTRSLQLYVLLVCSLTIVTIECAQEISLDGLNTYNVSKTIVANAELKGAVCLDGTPSAYYFEPGFGEGVENWVIQISGGAWCTNTNECLARTSYGNGSSKFMENFTFMGIHSKNQSANPDFYNWNKVFIAYCDGGSFVGDVEYVDPATKLHFRGARIFNAVIEELLAKGLKSAKNALLAGSSAGGYPAILYCDRFRDLLPNTSRVKCLVDCGYFVHFDNPVLAQPWDARYGGIAKLQGAAQTLPKSCTSKMEPAKCLYAENIIEYTKTPVFIFMSAFDNIETTFTLVSAKDLYNRIQNGTCTKPENSAMQEIKSNFIAKLPKGDNPKHRGVFVDSLHHHTSLLKRWTPELAIVVDNVSHIQGFADWYFDRSYTYIIDQHNDLPLPNNF